MVRAARILIVFRGILIILLISIPSVTFANKTAPELSGAAAMFFDYHNDYKRRRCLRFKIALFNSLGSSFVALRRRAAASSAFVAIASRAFRRIACIVTARTFNVIL